MNELCGGVDIVVEEDGDKTDDGRYYYFGIYIKCICVIYAMDFLCICTILVICIIGLS